MSPRIGQNIVSKPLSPTKGVKRGMFPLVMLFDTLVAKVRRNYASYEEFRAAIVPELQSAHQIVAPKAQGDGAFVPPHMVTTIEGDVDVDELIALEAIGQVFHEDVLRAK